MRILLISQWFQPEPFYKGLPFAKKLVERGHQVQVLTGFPNYPAGRLYDGYRVRLFQREMMDGIEVLRVPLYPSHDSSALGRIANYLSFAASASLIGPWTIRKADVCYVYHPPPTTYLPAFLIKLLRRIPVVYDIQDFWPDTLAATGMFRNKIGLKLVDGYCRLFYKAANKLVVLSPGFKRKLMEKGVPDIKIDIIYNWCDDSDIFVSPPDPELAAELNSAERFIVLFAGNMGKAQKLETVLMAASMISKRHPDILFVLIGGGVEVQHLKDLAVQMNLSNVMFLPPRPPSQIGPVLSLADVLLVHLKSDPLFEITIPSKIQAYMAVGKPILAAVPGDASDLIEKANCGLSCPSENPEELVNKIGLLRALSQQQRTQMGKNGRQFYEDNLSMSVGISRFEQVFSQVINRNN